MRLWKLTKRAPKMGAGDVWCKLCREVHTAKVAEAAVKRDPDHGRHFEAEAPVPIRMSHGAHDVEFAPSKRVFSGVPEEIALRAVETGFFEAVPEDRMGVAVLTGPDIEFTESEPETAEVEE